MKTKPDFVNANIDSLKELREQKGISRTTLRQWTGLNENLLRDYEEGYRKPMRLNYNKLADVFSWVKWEA